MVNCYGTQKYGSFFYDSELEFLKWNINNCDNIKENKLWYKKKSTKFKDKKINEEKFFSVYVSDKRFTPSLDMYTTSGN